MLRIGIGMCFVPVGLAGLRQEDQRCGICGLQAESKIQEDKRIRIEVREIDHAEHDPDTHDDTLCDQKGWRSKEAGKVLRFHAEPVVSKSPGEVLMRREKSEIVSIFSQFPRSYVRCWHNQSPQS